MDQADFCESSVRVRDVVARKKAKVKRRIKCAWTARGGGGIAKSPTCHVGFEALRWRSPERAQRRRMLSGVRGLLQLTEHK